MTEEVSTTDSSSESSAESTRADSIVEAQGIEGPSEAELRGEDIGSTEVKTDETEEVIPGKAEENQDEEKSTVTEEKPAISEPKAEETPKGFVPLAAVHEARGEIRYLKEQLKSVQEQVSTMQVKPVVVEDTPEDFEVLTDEEFTILAEDDATQAAIYLRNLNAFETKQRVTADEAKQQAEFEVAYTEIIDTSVAAIEKIAPGIYDENSEVQKELLDFAEGIGFTDDMYYLTNPSTKIILPGESEPLLLGEQAASILGMLVTAKGKMAAPEAKLRAEITAELVKKFKTPETTEYKSLTQVSKVSEESVGGNSFTGKVLTSAQLNKLTDAEYESYLAGD